MPKSTHPGVWLVAMGLAALGCGGANQVPIQSAPPAASAGDEPPPVAAPARVEAPRKSGPGSLVMQAQVDGKPIAARARVLDSERTIEFGMGEEISLQPGTHSIEVAVSDAETLVDKPSQQLEVFIQSGEQAKPVVSFPFARVQLNVLVGGRPQPGAALKLIRNGSVVADLKTSANPILVTPGKYEADVVVQGAMMRVKGLVFFEGSTQTVPVRAHF